MIWPLSLGKFLGPGQVTLFQVTSGDIDVFPVLSSSTLTDMAAIMAAIIPSDVSSPSLNNNLEAHNESCVSFSMHLIPDQIGNA